MRALPVLAFAVAAVIASAPTSTAATHERSCGRFIVGQANSTAYPKMKLPARGTVVIAACSTLRRIARRLHDGTYRIPSSAQAPPFKWGRPFTVRDQGRTWSCQLQHQGGSGPTYALRCRRGAARLRWHAG